MIKFNQHSPLPPKKTTDPFQKQNLNLGLFQAEHFRPKSCFFLSFFLGWVGVEIEVNANSAKVEVEVEAELSNIHISKPF